MSIFWSWIRKFTRIRAARPRKLLLGAAVAKFASGGKPGPKKDLGLMAMTYGNVYAASVAMGARNEQTIKAFLEAESLQRWPSLIIAYSHCIAHGINMDHRH
jgi:pyruvate-ferredoxin/flavodoxin oxidoreductase